MKTRLNSLDSGGNDGWPAWECADTYLRYRSVIQADTHRYTPANYASNAGAADGKYSLDELFKGVFTQSYYALVDSTSNHYLMNATACYLADVAFPGQVVKKFNNSTSDPTGVQTILTRAQALVTDGPSEYLSINYGVANWAEFLSVFQLARRRSRRRWPGSRSSRRPTWGARRRCRSSSPRPGRPRTCASTGSTRRRTKRPIGSNGAPIVAAYNAGRWDGAGLTSAVAAASGGRVALGWAEATTLGLSTFEGLALGGGNALLVKYALNGDTNLDDRVDFQDYLRVRVASGQAGGWTSGEFQLQRRNRLQRLRPHPRQLHHPRATASPDVDDSRPD